MKSILLLTIFITAIIHAQVIIPTTGLVASYPFNGNANDASGNNNNGVLNGTPTLTADRFGNANKAYSFGGYYDVDFIKVTNSPTLQFGKKMSASLWYKQCSFGGMDGNGNYVPNGQHIILGKAGDGYAAAPGIWCGTSTLASATMTTFFNNKNFYGNSINFAGSATFNCFDACEWVHLAVVIDSNIYKFYFNGVLQLQQTITVADFTNANTQPMYIGKMDGAWYPFNGVIDDINIYNRALTSAEVAGLNGGYTDPLNTSVLNLNTVTSKNTSCNYYSAQIMATGSGSLQYSIDGGANWQNTNYFSGLSGGTYTLSVKNNCLQKDTSITFASQCCETKIFFSSPKTSNAISNIWVMDSSGANRQFLFNDVYHRQALALAKDGSMLAYSKRKNPNNNPAYFSGGDSLWICTSNLDGSNEQVRYLIPTYISTECRNISFNNAKTAIIFNTYDAGGPSTSVRDGDLYQLQLATNTVTRLTTDVDFAKLNPNYATVDSIISFSYLSSGWLAHPIPAYKMNLNTGIRTLFAPSSIVGGNYSSTSWSSGLQYSPNGKMFVFQRATGAGAIPSLYLSDTSGTGLVNLNYNNIGLNQSIFSTSGKSIAIHDNNNLKYLTLTGAVYKTIAPALNTSFWDINWVSVKKQIPFTVNKFICIGQSFEGHTATGIYLDTIYTANACDSVRSLNLTANPLNTITINKTICAGQNYLGYTSTGIYLNTLTAINGCDTIRTLNLTVNPSIASTLNQTICAGQSFEGYTSAGTYTNTFTAANGCDSVRTLNLIIAPQINTTINQIICEGQSYLGYTATGIYVNNFATAGGCDSIRTLNLTVKPKALSTINQAICAGQSFEGYTTAGTHVNTFTAANGCDSVRTLNLTIKPNIASTINIAICTGQIYAGYNATGIYVNTFTAANGCDSVRTLNLTVNTNITSTINKTICANQTFEGYNTTGIYNDNFIAASGCDSVRTLNLTVLPKIETIINKTICFDESFLGYNTTGTHSNTYTAGNGCDSVRIINLVVNALPTPNLGTDKAICQNDSLVLNPGIFNTYIWQNVSTQPTLVAKQQGQYFVTVTNANNCKATDTFNLIKVNPLPFRFLPPDTALCLNGTINIGANGYSQYTWSTGSNNNSIAINAIGTYTLTVKDANNCIGKDTINVAPKECISKLFVPNTFSPNADGKNDVFKPLLPNGFTNFNFGIYNRWGQLIFNTTNINNGWDGTFKNKNQPIGVYVFVVKATNLSGISATEKGTVLLIR